MIRDSVQSSAGLLKVHMFRCFQKISLILCNSDIIFRIMFIIKLQSSRGALVALLVSDDSLQVKLVRLLRNSVPYVKTIGAYKENHYAQYSKENRRAQK